MPRYVILFHELPQHYARPSHWDLMLECDLVLRTWALAKSPQPDVPIDASALPDHRIQYLEYEGPVSGDRGTVSRWDFGTYEAREQRAEKWLIDVRGQRLNGEIQLERCSASDDQRWTFKFGGAIEAT